MHFRSLSVYCFSFEVAVAVRGNDTHQPFVRQHKDLQVDSTSPREHAASSLDLMFTPFEIGQYKHTQNNGCNG